MQHDTALNARHNGHAMAAILAAGIGAFAMGLVVIVSELGVSSPALYAPAGVAARSPRRAVYVPAILGPALEDGVAQLTLEHAQELRTVSLEFGLAHAGYLQQLVAGRGSARHHLEQHLVAKDDVGWHAAFVREFTTQHTQLLEQLAIVVAQRCGVESA